MDMSQAVLDVDSVCLDMEDGVALNRKEVRLLFQHPPATLPTLRVSPTIKLDPLLGCPREYPACSGNR